MAKINWSPGQLKTKILPLEHTGRLRPHHHTSYGSLLLVVGLALLPLLVVQHRVSADNTTEGVYAVVPSPIPTTAPQITNLASGRVFTTNDSYTLTGTCPNKTFVKVFKNDVLGGTATCKNGGFSLPLDLFIGSNLLTARAVNADDIAGPDSAALTVKLLPAAAAGANAFGAAGNSSNGQFYVTSSAYYRGVNAGDTLNWPLTIAGGQAPYNLTISWGDGKTETLSQGTPGQLTISHVYAKPAVSGSNYTVVIKSLDQTGATALLQLVAVVPGSSKTAAGLGSSGAGLAGWLKFAGQGLAAILLVVISFWIGEKRELYVIKHRPVGAA